MRNSSRPGGSTPTACPQWDSSWPRYAGNEEWEEVWTYFEERFDIPRKVGAEYHLWEMGRTYWALSDSSLPVEPMASLKIVSAGIPLARRIRGGLKPTSVGLRLLAKWAKKNRILLTGPEAEELLIEGVLPWRECSSLGYVILETESGVLGCGLKVSGRLLSQIPKSEVKALGWADP